MPAIASSPVICTTAESSASVAIVVYIESIVAARLSVPSESSSTDKKSFRILPHDPLSDPGDGNRAIPNLPILTIYAYDNCIIVYVERQISVHVNWRQSTKYRGFTGGNLLIVSSSPNSNCQAFMEILNYLLWISCKYSRKPHLASSIKTILLVVYKN